MSIKKILLEALTDEDIDEASNEALVNLLVDRLKRQKEHIQELEGKNAHERLCLQSDRERLHEEIMDLRRNPNKLITTQAFFHGHDKGRYHVVMESGRLFMYEAEKDVRYVCNEVPPADFGEAA